ncbi:MAG: hypothetical protein KY476_02600 [Planctomycetes bacterium]|nr:hypothetical protein [Planctomycetota bacterium]
MLRRLWFRSLFQFRHPGIRSRRRSPERRPLPACEALESRRLLSAASPEAAAEVCLEAHTEHAGPTRDMTLTIVGTEIQYDPATGLPVYMAGEVYYSNGRYAGTYEEVLTPIIHPEYGFVGTVGVSTIEFQTRGGHMTFGEVTTTNTSYITGMDPATGVIQVASTGEITEGERLFARASGGLESSSQVVLGPNFSMQTQVTLEYSRLHPPHGCLHSQDGDSGHHDHSHRGHHVAHLKHSEPAWSIRDRAFANWNDWA